MLYSAAQKIIAAINDGEVGGTYSNTLDPTPTDGYWIGGGNSFDSLINPTAAQIVEFVAHANSAYFGFWYDSDNTLYVDAVTHTTSERWAARLTALRDEIAYYDNNTNQEVRV